MAPRIIYDLATIDWNQVEFDIEAIRLVNPQRYEFEQLTAINKLLLEDHLVIGYRDVRSDEFWVNGHIPGNPLFPGVLMLEAAAQLGSFFCGKYYEDDQRFFGFGAIDGVKFRGSVVPGDRLCLICNAVKLSPRRAVLYTQGVVGDKLVFEAHLTGLAIG
jgi:3-hydroxyacyl-[acyl-carrier-protein] dehydratase